MICNHLQPHTFIIKRWLTFTSSLFRTAAFLNDARTAQLTSSMLSKARSANYRQVCLRHSRLEKEKLVISVGYGFPRTGSFCDSSTLLPCRAANAGLRSLLSRRIHVMISQPSRKRFFFFFLLFLFTTGRALRPSTMEKTSRN